MIGTKNAAGFAEEQESSVVRLTVHVRDALGLHARPAARLAQAAGRFAADVEVSFSGLQVDAKSILDLLSLCAPKGSSLSVTCSGSDAGEAATVISRLFENALFCGDE